MTLLFICAVISVVVLTHLEERRKSKLPKWELDKAWDIETATYSYQLYHYGEYKYSGDKEWAKKTAKHYKIKINKD